MNCERYEGLMVSYMDGRATDAERREVELHLVACAGCRARVEEYRRLWSALEEAPAPAVSPNFDARLRARIAAEPQRRWFDLLVPSPRLAFATAALLVLSVWIGSLPNAPANVSVGPRTEEEARAVKDLQSLEDLDVLSDFEALVDLPPAKARPSKI
jgi:anti-sigma factor RsiW